MKAQTIKLLASIAVGKRGTNPVFMYSITTGMANIVPTTNKIAAIKLKNNSGRSSFINNAIVLNIRIPSLYVDNLETEPSGREKYFVGTSFMGNLRDNA